MKDISKVSHNIIKVCIESLRVSEKLQSTEAGRILRIAVSLKTRE